VRRGVPRFFVRLLRVEPLSDFPLVLKKESSALEAFHLPCAAISLQDLPGNRPEPTNTSLLCSLPPFLDTGGKASWVIVQESFPLCGFRRGGKRHLLLILVGLLLTKYARLHSPLREFSSRLPRSLCFVFYPRLPCHASPH